MARLARVVVPELPHHVTQRGNRRQQTFFCDDDYRRYLDLMRQWCTQYQVQIWAYCLMPNHVHLILVPPSEDGLARAVGEAHRRYTRHVNFREGWRGHLWQGRFASFVMDEAYLLAATRYVERNPVRARLVDRAADWPWSSAGVHTGRVVGGLAACQWLRDDGRVGLLVGGAPSIRGRTGACPVDAPQRKYRQTARIDGIRPKARGRFKPPPAPQPGRTAQKKTERRNEDENLYGVPNGTPCKNACSVDALSAGRTGSAAWRQNGT